MIAIALVLAAAQATAPTLTLGEVDARQDRGAALKLAARVLPPEVAARVVEGTVRRQWLPGQVWWIGFRERARVAGADLCERQAHSVEAAAAQAANEAPADTVLTVGAPRSWVEAAVLPPGTRATPAACETAAFIAIPEDGARQVAAYRVLVAAMAAARGRARLPFAVTCRAEKPQACADARAALATLPMDALGGIGVSCLDEEKRRDVHGAGGAIISCPPPVRGARYQAEVSFGMSGDDGQSWRAGFVHRAGWPAEIALRRSMVIYH